MKHASAPNQAGFQQGTHKLTYIGVSTLLHM